MPRAFASPGPRTDTGRPSKKYSPLSGVSTPEITLTNVDFPAPLSPTSPTTSPGYRCMSTLDRACTPPKLFETPRSSMTFWRVCAVVDVVISNPFSKADCQAEEQRDG